MSVIDELVYDRTQADVDRVYQLKGKILANGLSSLTDEEKAEYMGGMKGAYNYTDLNRVGQAVAYIATRMTTIESELSAYRIQKGIADDPNYRMPYTSSDIIVTAKTNWTVRDIPTRTQINAYIQDLGTLRNALNFTVDTPPIPTTLDSLTYVVANNIEKLLWMIDTRLTEVAAERYSRIDQTVVPYSGLIYAGE